MTINAVATAADHAPTQTEHPLERDESPPNTARLSMSDQVLIIDDHPLFSTSLAIALRGHGLRVREVHPDNVDQIARHAAEAGPGLVLLDLNLGLGVDGVRLRAADIIRRLRRPDRKVLIMSAGLNRTDTAAAIAAGAVGVVAKSEPLETLLHIIDRAASGRPVMTDAERRQWLYLHAAQRAHERDLQRRLALLSRREREVLELLANGQRAAVIAARSVVSITTTRTQIRAILAKLGVNSQLEAVAMLARAPLPSP